MVYKYRVFCQTDMRYEYVLSTQPPTSCPVNPAHAIDLNQVVVKEVVDVPDGTLVDPNINLDEYKKIKKTSIDIKTRELILSGFTYDNVLFSSSETAQRNWMALDQFKAFHSYPVSVTTEDDNSYSFATAEEISNFVLTAVGTINYHYSTGRALKIQVNVATDLSGVDAVVDNR